MSDNLSKMSDTTDGKTRSSGATPHTPLPHVFTTIPTVYELTAQANDAQTMSDDGVEAIGVDIAQEVIAVNYENGVDVSGSATGLTPMALHSFSTIEQAMGMEYQQQQQPAGVRQQNTVTFRPASMPSIDETEASDREVYEINANAGHTRHVVSISPIELINRHLLLGTEIYTSKSCPAKELCSDTNGDRNGSAISPQHDEIAYFRNNMSLMYAQVLFERQQREACVTRNRELAKQVKECAKLQEEFSAQKDLLELQENEIETQKAEINSLREKNRNLENKNAAERDHYNQKIASLTQKCRQLENTNTELEQDFASYKDQTKILQANYQTVQAKNLELEEDLNLANIANGSTAKTTKENQNLKHKLLLLSEHYQLLKNKYLELKKNAYASDIELIESEARAKDLKDMRAKLDSATVHLDAFRSKCAETEAFLLKKEGIITELKQLIETIKLSHKTQIQAEKERINALNKMCQQYEQRILKLYGQLGLREHEQRLRDSANNMIADNNGVGDGVPNSHNNAVDDSSPPHSSSNSNHNYYSPPTS